MSGTKMERRNEQDRTAKVARGPQADNTLQAANAARTHEAPAREKAFHADLTHQLELFADAVKEVSRGRSAEVVAAALDRAERLAGRQREGFDLRLGREDDQRSVLAGRRAELDRREAADRRPEESPDIRSAAFRAEQRRQLDELEAVSRTVLDGLGARQAADFSAERSALVADLIRSDHDAVTSARRDTETGGLRTDAARNTALRASVDDAAQRYAEAARALLRHVGVESAQIVDRLTPRELDRFRSEVAKVVPEVATLPDDALSRAMSAGRNRTGEVRLGAIRGQLAEELNNRQAEQAALARGHQFIRGDRVRDAKSRQLTDGLEVGRRADGSLALHRAFEVKAGQDAARSLTARTSSLSVDDRKELRLAARDLARRDVLARRRAELDGISEDQARQQIALQEAHDPAAVVRAELEAAAADQEGLTRRTAVHQDELRAAQEEDGQLGNTAERLAESTAAATTRVFIDGVEALLHRETTVRDTVHAVVPRGTHNDAGAAELEATQQQLEDAARALDELRR